MIPIRDDVPRRQFPFITLTIIGLNVVVFFWELLLGPELLEQNLLRWAIVPTRYTVPDVEQSFTLPQQILPFFTSMFLHVGWTHLLGNMWFLWIFGNNVEDAMGRGRFVVFYLLCGVVAALAQVCASPASAVPLVGASGAISGVMGGYLVLYPRVRVHMLVWLGFFITTIAVPAYLMLIYWMLLQLLGDNVAEDAALLLFEVLAPGPQFVEHPARHKRGRGQLGVGVFELLAGAGSVVLEDADVFEAAVALQVLDALRGQEQELSDFGVAGLPHLPVVARILDQHFVRPQRAHAVINAVTAAAGFALQVVGTLAIAATRGRVARLVSAFLLGYWVCALLSVAMSVIFANGSIISGPK